MLAKFHGGANLVCNKAMGELIGYKAACMRWHLDEAVHTLQEAVYARQADYPSSIGRKQVHG